MPLTSDTKVKEAQLLFPSISKVHVKKLSEIEISQSKAKEPKQKVNINLQN